MNFNLEELSFLIKTINEKIALESKVSVEVPVVKEEPPVKPKRCQHEGCKTKLVLSDFVCRCKNYYCSSHRYSDIHKCSFDYQATGKDTLRKQNPAIVAEKFERI
jgi:hypothetical protein